MIDQEDIEAVIRAVKSIANAVTPLGAIPTRDVSGGSVGSLTEAVIGVTAGLHAIAFSIDNLAEAIREHK